MALDLRLSPGLGLEQGMWVRRFVDGHSTHWRTEAVRTAAWIIAAVKAYMDGDFPAAAGLALGALSSGALLLLYAMVNRHLALRPQQQTSLWLLFSAMVAVNLLQCQLGMLFFQAIYPEGAADVPLGAFARLRACMLASMACGVMWLVFYGRMAPLPFKYQWPQLTVAALMMLRGTDTMCSNSNMQVGHAELHRVLRHLVLPILLPATAYSLPDTSGLQAGPGPEARALCQTHQPAVIVIGLTAVLLSIYQAEAQQRAHMLRGLGQQQTEESVGSGASGQQPLASADASASGAQPGDSGPSSADAPAPRGAGAAAAAAATSSSLMSSQEVEVAPGSLPLAARPRAQAWLLAATFLYIVYSSWPAATAPALSTLSV